MQGSGFDLQCLERRGVFVDCLDLIRGFGFGFWVLGLGFGFGVLGFGVW